MEINDLTYNIIGCVYKVHSALGPGLLESTYEVCLAHELALAKLTVERQKALPVIYDDVKLDAFVRNSVSVILIAAATMFVDRNFLNKD